MTLKESPGFQYQEGFSPFVSGSNVHARMVANLPTSSITSSGHRDSVLPFTSCFTRLSGGAKSSIEFDCRKTVNSVLVRSGAESPEVVRASIKQTQFHPETPTLSTYQNLVTQA